MTCVDCGIGQAVQPNAKRPPVSLLGSSSPGYSGPPETSHPSAGQLEATVFGWLPEHEARAIRAHAASCAQCGPAIQREEGVHRRLRLLRTGEPPIEVAQHVLNRLDHVARARTLPRPTRIMVVVLSLVVAGVLVASSSNIRQTVRRLGAVMAL
jgi:hypothetical protein